MFIFGGIEYIFILMIFCIQVFPLWCVHSDSTGDVYLRRNCIYFCAHDFLHSGISTLVCAFRLYRRCLSSEELYIFLCACFFCIQVFPLWCVHSDSTGDVFLWRNCIYFYTHDFLHSGISTLVCAFRLYRRCLSSEELYIFLCS